MIVPLAVGVFAADNVSLTVVDDRSMPSHARRHHDYERENSSHRADDHQNDTHGMNIETVLKRVHRQGESKYCSHREYHDARC